jgi:SAM-dependent methyltransferase
MRAADFYDETYFDGPGKSNYQRYTLDSSPFALQANSIVRLLRFYGIRGPVLDVGCAKGYLVYMLRQRGIEAFGVDWSEYAIANASPDVQPYVQTASATQLPFLDGYFAVTASFDVLEHMDEESSRLALQECARVSAWQFHQVNTGRLSEWAYERDESHCQRCTLEEWQALAGRLGLEQTLISEPDLRLPFLDAVVP